MAKKKGGSRRGAAEEADEFDTSSTCSTLASTDSTAPDDVLDESPALQGYIDELYEKRGASREAGLRGIISSLVAHVQTEFAEDNLDTLLHQVSSCVKKGSATEAALAARALGLLALTLGAGESSEQVLSDAGPLLLRLGQQGAATAARVAGLEALGMVAFVGAPDAHVTEETMDSLWDMASEGRGIVAPVRTAALAAWALLLSTVPPSRAGAHYLETCLPMLSRLLHDPDLAVRTAAGEALALLSELGRDHMSPDFAAEAEGWDQSGDDTAGEAVLGTEVIEKMRSLAIEGGSKRQSKRERAQQRSNFRELLATVEGGSCSETTIKLKHGDVLCIDTWSQTIQMNAFRRYLAEGFQRHMQDNSLLHQVFNFAPRAEALTKLSAREKRMYMSPNSAYAKARTVNRNRRRTSSQASNLGHFGGGGGHESD